MNEEYQTGEISWCDGVKEFTDLIDEESGVYIFHFIKI